MSFACAVFALMRGHKVRRHHWTGYWYFDKDKKTVIMHMHDGGEQDIRDTNDIIYTLSNFMSSHKSKYSTRKVHDLYPLNHLV